VPELLVEPLEKAIRQLELGLADIAAQPGNDLMRDGVIQRFEYTMDLCWKLIQRYLKVEVGLDESMIRSKKDLFREAARIKLIESAEAWIGHLEARNSTSHSYDATVAQAVFERAGLFLADARALLKGLINAA
jgi:nucleotidyltransferase substrate binding protein (TIGR01987 family)